MIKQLQPEGLADVALLDMGEMFFQESRLPGKFNRVVFVRTWETLMRMGCATIFVARHNEAIIGAIGCIVHPDPNDGAMVANEMFWFMHPHHRSGTDALRLYRSYEAWARKMGAQRITMSATFNDSVAKLRKFYQMLGFRAVDVSYFKELT